MEMGTRPPVDISKPFLKQPLDFNTTGNIHFFVEVVNMCLYRTVAYKKGGSDFFVRHIIQDTVYYLPFLRR